MGNEQRKVEENVKNESGENAETGRLQEAMRAFEAGDYRRVRQLVHELLGSDDAETRRAAQDLQRRVQADPVAAMVLLLCVALFIVIAYVYVLR